MNLFKRLSGGNRIATPAPELSVEAHSDWRKYRAGEGDKAGRQITRIYAADDDYVIYFLGCDLYYETAPELEKDLGSADAALARINRLLDANPPKNSREYEENVSILELAADALEMFFCGEKPEALEILNSLRDKLQAKEEAQRRLAYQGGAFSITALVWILYLLFQWGGWIHARWEPWILAAALAMAGGLFSVCLNIGSLQVNVNQQKVFLFFAGATRSIVALLAGTGLLLAMRSKMFVGTTYKGDPPDVADALKVAEMFFCFLAGFSESFVPNILSKTAADKAAAEAKATAEAKVAADKATADKAAAEAKAAADKAAADKAAADKAATAANKNHPDHTSVR
jgi:hypothetical protein